jgi:hypothetical protein
MRPLVFGYVRALSPTDDPVEDEDPSDSPAAEITALQDELTAFAEAEGLTLATIYTDRADTVPAAFHALVEAVRRHNAWGVVVPSLHHLGGPALPALKHHLEHSTGAHVLVVHATGRSKQRGDPR